MKRADRAKIFLPFAAMKGYDDALALKQLLTCPRLELAADASQELDTILHSFQIGDRVSVLHYDQNVYIKTAGIFRRLSVIDQTIQIDEKIIFLNDLLSAERLTP